MEISSLNVTELRNGLLKGEFSPKEILNSTINKINLPNLQKSKIIKNKYRKLKLLGAGDIKDKFDIEANYISKSAKEKIEKLGGKVILIK